MANTTVEINGLRFPNDDGEQGNALVTDGQGNLYFGKVIGGAETEVDPTVPQHVKDITETQIGEWTTAHGWGNHADAGYLTTVSFSDIEASSVLLSTETYSNVDTQLMSAAAIDDLIVGKGYLTSFTETDPIFSASPAAGISNTDITNWNTGYNRSPTTLSLTANTLTLARQGVTDLTVDLSSLSSGGDADTLDGINSTDFVRQGDLTHNNNYVMINRSNALSPALYVNNYGEGPIARFSAGTAAGDNAPITAQIDNDGSFNTKGAIKQTNFETVYNATTDSLDFNYIG